MTGTIRGTSKEKLYQELGLQSMKERWFRRLCCFYKILNNQAPAYLYSLFSPPNRHYNTHNYSKIRQIFCRTETFSNSFLPKTIREWNKLDTSICQAPSYSVFRKVLFDFMCPCSLESEDIYHFFMRCQNFSNQRYVLFHELNSINPEILTRSENETVQVLLFGIKVFRIITSSIRFIKDSKRFDETLSS